MPEVSCQSKAWGQGSLKQIVSLSGGKDSTAMLLMMLERGEQIDDIVFFDWGMEFPAMYEHLEKLEGYIKRAITRLSPPHSWDYYMFDILKTQGPNKGTRGYGWPAFKRRWCTGQKVDVLTAHQRKAYGDNGYVQCVGYSYEERRRRPNWKDGYRHPLLEWGVTEIEALKYCYNCGFDFGGLYKLFRRVSCWCCPLQSKRELQALRDNFPDLWQRLLDMDARTPYPWPNDNLQKVKGVWAEGDERTKEELWKST